jgi:hypothetical protein
MVQLPVSWANVPIDRNRRVALVTCPTYSYFTGVLFVIRTGQCHVQSYEQTALKHSVYVVPSVSSP